MQDSSGLAFDPPRSEGEADAGRSQGNRLIVFGACHPYSQQIENLFISTRFLSR